MRFMALAFAALAATPLSASALSVDPLVQSGQAGIDIVRAAALALGGQDHLKQMRSLTLDLDGNLYWVTQGDTPATVMTLGHRIRAHSVLGGEMAVVTDFRGPESSFQREAVVTRQSTADERVDALAMSPHLLVRYLLEHPNDVQLVRQDASGAVMTASVHGRLARFRIGADGLPRELDLLLNDDLHGDAIRTYTYDAYTRQGSWMVPRKLRQTDAGKNVLDVNLAQWTVDSERPSWAPAGSPQDIKAPEPSKSLRFRELAPGIHLLIEHGGEDYNGMLVDLPTGLMLLETPRAIATGEELRRVVASISPKPIIYAAATHHHDDHSAGMAAVARQGVTVLTTPGTVDFYTTMIGASRRFAGYEAKGSAAVVRPIRDGEKLGPVQFLNIGSMRHAKDHFVFYFPAHGLLFQSDMSRFSPGNPVQPARATGCSLLRAIERRKLRITTIISGHGENGTVDDLRKAVAARTEPCPSS